MKRLIVLILLIAGLATGGFYSFKQHQRSKCEAWLAEADQFMPQGYYASAIEVLTLYFSNKNCRTKTDIHAITLLSEARLHVPLPDNAHLAQEIMLNKLGWSLKRDPRYHLPQAVAYLGGEKWLEAQRSARKAEGQQAALILLAASIKLDDEENILHALEELHSVETSPLVWAIVETSLISAEAVQFDVKDIVPSIPREWRTFASRILAPSVPDGFMFLEQLSLTPLEGEDLTIATSLLLSEGRPLDAIAALENASEGLTAEQASLLAKLYWRIGMFHKLVYRFPENILDTAPLLNVQLLKCLGAYALEAKCEFKMDTADIQKRYGKYAASVWGELAQNLSNGKIEYAPTLNALERAGDILPDMGPIFQLKSKLYQAIGENELALIAEKNGAILSGKGPEWAVFENAGEKTDNTEICEGFVSDAKIDNLALIRACVEEADKTTNLHVEAIKNASPEKAIFWRLVEARYLLMSGESAQVAKAIQILRPVLKWAPNNARAFQLLSVAYAYFDDLEATYAHLATAVKLRPEFTVEATRLALGFYQNGKELSGKQLAHWWGAFTHIELNQYNRSSEVELRNLVRDRLMLLAQIAEDSKDHDLALAVYLKLLEIEEVNHIALNNLAYKLYETQGDLQHALELAERAVKLAPNVTEYQATLSDIQQAIEAQGS
ncbi:hypothetical protein KFE96_07710 [Kordiimonas sp. SCSIO 12603]|uniref:hypothetical protein n=1 Tax=Kordiimonas sp. SCSIO 12603 TaxID=2829596 RepID=UPI0021077EFB|nr:hypothetical protein [Kordiimonas sp. SCSIO 12603]UTW60189.1 hypothetical protein KFE96_07710 [Kordiimonas sp. SCSIO 12603]